MAKKGEKLKGVAAVSIVAVGIAMGATPIRGVGPDVATAASANSCDDFASAIFLKGQDLFNKADPFLKGTSVKSGFEKVGPDVGGFYQVSTGAAEVFMKNDFQGGVAGIAVCTEDANGVARDFFETDDTLDDPNTSVSFDKKVDNQQAFLVITMENTIITSTFKVEVSDFHVTITVDKSSP